MPDFNDDPFDSRYLPRRGGARSHGTPPSDTRYSVSLTPHTAEDCNRTEAQTNGSPLTSPSPLRFHHRRPPSSTEVRLHTSRNRHKIVAPKRTRRDENKKHPPVKTQRCYIYIYLFRLLGRFEANLRALGQRTTPGKLAHAVFLASFINGNVISAKMRGPRGKGRRAGRREGRRCATGYRWERREEVATAERVMWVVRSGRSCVPD